MAAAYDRDGNRVFQLNYNLHTDEDWKDKSGNGNGNNKDNTGSGNNGNGNSSSGNNSNSGNGNGNSGNNGNGNNKENSKSEGTDDAGYGNATNAEEHNSQNQSGILFPVAEEISRTETDLIAMIKTTGKEKDYELIEYILNVNTQYTQVLMELNENGALDAAYTYGVSRLTEDRFTGESNFYLYDPAGNVAGITDQDGYLWQSYRYDAFGNATFGSPQYDNEYTFNAESYNPNIQSQYLRSRYYDTVKGSFLTEDTYLGDIRNPLTLNRYSYCIGNPLFYSDPSGHEPTDEEITKIRNYAEATYSKEGQDWSKEYYKRREFLKALHIVRGNQYGSDYVINYDYAPSMNQNYVDYTIGKAVYLVQSYYCGNGSREMKTVEKWLDLYSAPTVDQRGRFVQIPLDRPREAGEYWGDEWAAPSWKSEEAVYDEGSKYINPEAYGIVKGMRLEPREKDDLKLMVTEVYGIERYWVAVGPRVMVPDYPFTDGEQIPSDKMKYGTCIDVILRDSDYNTYFMPAIVGDIKGHTLGSGYAKGVDIDGKKISTGKDSGIGSINGIYQTGYSWKDGEFAEEYKEGYDKPNGAVIEFIRPKGTKDNLLRTSEFDILGIIVYD